MHKKILTSALLVTILTGCTTNNEFYTGDDSDEFSTFNTIAFPIVVVGIVALAAAAAEEGGNTNSSNYVSCNGTYCNEDAAWDYLPGNDQYRCRSTQTGQFVASYYCSGQYQQDNWY